MAQSLKWKRVEAALSGQLSDRVPFAFWRHFPHLDREPDKLVQATLDFHRRYDMDYLKVMFRSTFGVEDWGCISDHYSPSSGSWQISDYPVKSVRDWRSLRKLDVNAGVLGEQLYVLKKVAREIGEEVPVLATLFSPTMLATHLSGTAAFLQHLQEDREAVYAGLEIITTTLEDFGRACLDQGATGLFYAIQAASAKLLSEEAYRELGQRFDRPALEQFYRRCDFVMLHLHGEQLFFDELASYPAHVLNWYDRGDGPSLAEARQRTSKALAGGIDHERTLLSGQPEEIAAELAEAVRQVGGRGFLFAPGCGLPITVPEQNLKALRDAALRLG